MLCKKNGQYLHTIGRIYDSRNNHDGDFWVCAGGFGAVVVVGIAYREKFLCCR